VIIAALCLFLAGWAQVFALLVAIGCGAFLGWNDYPYSPLGKTEVRLAPPGPDQITVLSTNVLMKNENYRTAHDLITKVDPDILFLMETDQGWLDAMEPALQNYGTVIRETRDNYYGMIFATRLPVADVQVLYLADNETPTLFAEDERKVIEAQLKGFSDARRIDPLDGF